MKNGINKDLWWMGKCTAPLLIGAPAKWKKTTKRNKVMEGDIAWHVLARDKGKRWHNYSVWIWETDFPNAALCLSDTHDRKEIRFIWRGVSSSASKCGCRWCKLLKAPGSLDYTVAGREVPRSTRAAVAIQWRGVQSGAGPGRSCDPARENSWKQTPTRNSSARPRYYREVTVSAGNVKGWGEVASEDVATHVRNTHFVSYTHTAHLIFTEAHPSAWWTRLVPPRVGVNLSLHLHSSGDNNIISTHLTCLCYHSLSTCVCVCARRCARQEPRYSTKK